MTDGSLEGARSELAGPGDQVSEAVGPPTDLICHLISSAAYTDVGSVSAR